MINMQDNLLYLTNAFQRGQIKMNNETFAAKNYHINVGYLCRQKQNDSKNPKASYPFAI